MNLTKPCPVVFTAQSKHDFYCRNAVCEFVLEKGCVPLNPFNVFGYFLDDRVDRDLVRRGNFNLVRICDELWVFGPKIANGVLAEIEYARELRKPIRFFSISAEARDIVAIAVADVQFEKELRTEGKHEADFVSRMLELSGSDEK